MNLGATLAPIAARTIAQFNDGVTARLRFSTPQRQADASTAPQWNDVAGLTAAPIILVDIGAERALKKWGAEKVVHVEATVAVPVGTTLSPLGLGLFILAGARAGTRYLVVGVQMDDTSRVATLALQFTRDTLGLP